MDLKYICGLETYSVTLTDLVEVLKLHGSQKQVGIK